MRSQGFTLVETILYLALFSILMTGIIVSVFVLFESSDRSQTRAMLSEEKEYLIGKINYALSGAKFVTVGTTLEVTKYDTSTVRIEGNGQNLIYNDVVLNNTNTSVSNLTFIHTFAGGNSPESVEVGFTISSRTPDGETISQVASTTRYLRK